MRRLRSARDLRDVFASTSIDSDILDELAQHAESTYDELRADGASEHEALARVDRLIDGVAHRSRGAYDASSNDRSR